MSLNSEFKVVSTNPNARNFEISETIEAGIALLGTEIKSIRQQSPQLKEAYVEIRARSRQTKHFEAWLLNFHIPAYSHANRWNHELTRDRKLLLHRKQLSYLYGAVLQKGMAIIPIRLYLKSGRLKVFLGLGKGKKHYDKRQDLKKKDAEREIQVFQNKQVR